MLIPHANLPEVFGVGFQVLAVVSNLDGLVGWDDAGAPHVASTLLQQLQAR